MPSKKQTPLWQTLRFGLEIEFINARIADIELLPGWTFHAEDSLYDDTGQNVPDFVEPNVQGGEVVSPPLSLKDLHSIEITLNRIRNAGGKVNWSSGVHVHVEIKSWGEKSLILFLEEALNSESAIRDLLDTAHHRYLYNVPTTRRIVNAFIRARDTVTRQRALTYGPHPFSQRGGINLHSYWKFGTVEFRFANGSLNYQEVKRVITLYLKYTAAILEKREIPDTPVALAKSLGVPATGYPAPKSAPRWWWNQTRYQYVAHAGSLIHRISTIEKQFGNWVEDRGTDGTFKRRTKMKVEYVYDVPTLLLRAIAPSRIRQTIAFSDIPKSQEKMIRKYLNRQGETETITVFPTRAAFIKKLLRM